MKFVHTADWHFGYRQYGFLDRENDFYEAGVKLADGIENVDAVIVAGDIFDSQKPPAIAVKMVQQIVHSLNRREIEVFGIDGNHDAAEGDWLAICNVRRLNPTIELKDGIRIHGIPAMRPAAFNAAVDKLVTAGERIDVLVIHQALGEMADFDSHEITAINLAPRLAKLGVRYVAMGDIHDYHEMDLGGIRFVYSGTIEMNAIDEKQDKSVSYIDITAKELHTSYKPLTIRPILERHLKTQAELDMLLADIGTAKKPPLVVVWYVPEAKDLARRAESVLQDRGLMFRVVPLATSAVGTIAQQLARQGLERKGALVQLKDAVAAFFDEKSEQYQLVFQMLDAPDNTIDIIKQYLKSKGIT